MLAITHDEPTKLTPFLKENAYTFPVGSDSSKKTASTYGISGFPTSILVDRDGKILLVGSPSQLEAELEKIFGDVSTKEQPFSKLELTEKLGQGSFAAIIDDLVTRPIDKETKVFITTLAKKVKATKTQTKNDKNLVQGGKEFIEYCQSQNEEFRIIAKKGLMIKHWFFGKQLPDDDKLNTRFWDEVSLTAMSDKDAVIGDRQVNAENIDEFIELSLAKYFLCKDLADGNFLEPKDIKSKITKESNALFNSLKSTYPLKKSKK